MFNASVSEKSIGHGVRSNSRGNILVTNALHGVSNNAEENKASVWLRGKVSTGRNNSVSVVGTSI